MNVVSQWLGEVPYEQALQMQDETAKIVQDSGRAVVLGLEHPPTITLGVRGNPNKDILSRENFEVVKIRRGGEATIHNPGQLVIYPIVPIKEIGISVRCFVEVIMASTENLCRHWGLQLYRKDEPGLYTSKGKLCFVGIQVKQGISRHGLSLNVKNDLSDFQNISVCGVKNENLDRLGDYPEVSESTEELFNLWLKEFDALLSSKVFAQNNCGPTKNEMLLAESPC